MCQWNWIAITKSTTTYANKCQLNIFSIITIQITNQQTTYYTTNAIYITAFYANFRNSTSCRIFDEVKTCQNLYQPLITIMQKIAIVIMIQNATKCHEMPCNHQFERRYINPRVTYVEKPKRLQLNPLVSGQLTRFLIFIWVIRWNRQYLRRKLSRITQMLKWKNRVSKPRYISLRALT